MTPLRISQIEIENAFGTRYARFNPGTVTRIMGTNGSGKSSILRALAFVFAGGSDPSIIRKGAESSKIEIRLNDGTAISKVTRPRRARKGGEISGFTTDLEVTQPDGTPRPAPQTYINELAESLSVDPSVLLRIDVTTAPGRKQLATELMKLVPISFAPEEVNRACAYRSSSKVPHGETDAIALTQSPESALDLDGLKKCATSVTEQRRREGQVRDDADGAINRLQKSLPEDDGIDHAGRLRELETEGLEIERAIADRRVEVESQVAAALQQARKDAGEVSAAAEREYREALAAIEKIRAEKLATAQSSLKERELAIADLKGKELADLEREAAPEQQRVAAETAAVKEKLAAHHRAHTLRQEIEIQLSTLRAAAWKYDQLSGVLERLDHLRLEKLNHLPVAGLVVEDGQVYLDGVEWANVNLARRVEAVLQICTQRSGRLPLLLIDDSEHLDSETRAAIEEGLAVAGFQVIEACVTDEPLSIEIADRVAA